MPTTVVHPTPSTLGSSESWNHDRVLPKGASRKASKVALAESEAMNKKAKLDSVVLKVRVVRASISVLRLYGVPVPPPADYPLTAEPALTPASARSYPAAEPDPARRVPRVFRRFR